MAVASAAAANSPAGVQRAPAQVLLDPHAHPASAGSTLSSAPLAGVSSPLNFNFTPVGNLAAMQAGTPAQQALAAQVINGFVTAGDRWRAAFADPITLNVDIDFGPIGNGVLGGTNSGDTVQSYATVRTQLALDAKSLNDVTAVAKLQVGPSMQFMTNDTATNISPATSPRIRDNDTVGTAANNNNFLDINRANAKALGIAVSAGSDANITFTDFSDYASPLPVPPNIGWDFDPSDGIAAKRIDFVGVASHEIGHSMGFVSGTDTVDFVGSPNGPGRLPANGGPYDLDQFAIYNTLDLYRFSADSLAQAGQPLNGLRDGAFGQASAASRPFFSIDGGATNIAPFSTGAFNGDGNQASHWQDNLGIGIMDPTFALGELGVITPNDLIAMDAIGWDPLLPEPSGVGISLTGIIALSIRHRRKSLLPGRRSPAP